MNQVSLQPDGHLKREDHGEIQNPLTCLGQQVVLDDGCTLRSYFFMLKTYPVFCQLGVFYNHLMDQYQGCPASDCRWDAFDYLEFSKTVEMIGYPGEPRLEIYNIFQGVHGAKVSEIRSLALEFLLDMPLRLGPLKHIVFGDQVDTFSFETVYTLFEFIDSIAWELSFHGTPAQCKL